MKLLLKVLALVCLCVPMWGQGYRYDSNAFTSAENVPAGSQSTMFTVPFAKITVCAYPDNGQQPCTNTVPIYQDPSLTVTAQNPITADVHGRFGFWKAAGFYTFSVQDQSGTFLGTYLISLGGAGGETTLALTTNGTSGPSTLTGNPAAGYTLNVPDYQSTTFEQQVIPPIGGQYVVVYPTAGTITSDPRGDSIIGPKGGNLKWSCSGILCTIAPDMTATWSGFALPSYVDPANVTAVYADAVSSGTPLLGQMPFSGANTGKLSCSGMSGTQTVFPTYPTGAAWGLQELNHTTTLTGAQVSTASCSISLGASGSGSSGITVELPAIRLLVFYTGPAPPARTAYDVQPPLSFNTSTLTLGDDALGVNTINGQYGDFTFGGSGVSCSGTSCTFTAGGSAAWSALTNPTGNLALTMGANTSTFTFNATTGSADLFSLTDTASNTGTGILMHPHTASGSTETPWQADANGVGWKVGTNGALTGVGSSTTHGITFPTASALPTPGASTAGLYSDTSGDLQAFENGGAFSRICTAGNGICAAAGGGFPITLGSTSVGSGSTTTTIAGLTLTAPTFTTPALGTPASGVLTNVTGLPLSTGVTGNLPNANLATQTANTVLGALTATTPSGLALPSCSGASNALIWTSGTGFGCNTISAGGGNTTSTSLTTNTLPKANGANSIINSLFTDDGTGGAYTGTGGFSAPAFLGTGSDHYLNIPSSPSHTVANSDLYNNAGALTWCATSGACATVNTGAFPASATVLGTNGSSLPIAATTTGSGTTVVLATSPTLVTPVLGAATATSLLATGIVDGTSPITLTTGTTATLGGTYNSGYTFNQEATAATAVTYTLPTAAAGKQYCTGNSYNGSAATTGVLTIATSASGQFIIFTDGTLSATGGNVTSGGAGGDAACFVGLDATHWQMYVQQGTWTKH